MFSRRVFKIKRGQLYSSLNSFALCSFKLKVVLYNNYSLLLSLPFLSFKISCKFSLILNTDYVNSLVCLNLNFKYQR